MIRAEMRGIFATRRRAIPDKFQGLSSSWHVANAHALRVPRSGAIMGPVCRPREGQRSRQPAADRPFPSPASRNAPSEAVGDGRGIRAEFLPVVPCRRGFGFRFGFRSARPRCPLDSKGGGAVSGFVSGFGSAYPSFRAASIMARMPARSASGSVGQASRTRCSSASRSFPVLRPVLSSERVSSQGGTGSALVDSSRRLLISGSKVRALQEALETKGLVEIDWSSGNRCQR
jgi:hypothetical protein